MAQQTESTTDQTVRTLNNIIDEYYRRVLRVVALATAAFGVLVFGVGYYAFDMPNGHVYPLGKALLIIGAAAVVAAVVLAIASRKRRTRF